MKPQYRYVKAKAVTKKLDALIKMPIYGVGEGALARYERDFYGKRCKASKAIVDKALNVIPGGVQHNLAFNYPFPLVFTKADGNRLYDVDGNVYFDFLQAGAARQKTVPGYPFRQRPGIQKPAVFPMWTKPFFKKVNKRFRKPLKSILGYLRASIKVLRTMSTPTMN